MTTAYSNSFPSGKEEVFLRELLSHYNGEFTSVSASIRSAHMQIESDQLSIKHLEESLDRTHDVLEIYEKRRRHLRSIHGELAICSSQLKPSSKRVPAPIPSLQSDVTAKIQAYGKEETELKRLCKKIRLKVDEMMEEIRCKRHHLHFTEMHLRTSVLNRDNITQLLRAVLDSFRPIKRLPDEIWLEIFGIAVDQGNGSLVLNAGDYVTSSHALLFSHVCLTWRRVILSSPKLWATIHCSALSSNYLEKRKKLMDILLQRAQGAKIILVDKRQYRSRADWGCAWWPEWSLEISLMLSGYKYHIILSDDARANFGPLSMLFGSYPKAVILEAAAPGEDIPLSDHLLSRIKDLKSLRIVNIMLRPQNPIVSQTLKRLEITFHSPLPTSGVNLRSYSLHPLLGDSLRSLSLSHYDPDMILWQEGTTIDLPDLQTLSITPHENHIISNIGLCKLNTLTISLPHGPLRVATEDWIKNLATICQNISTLTLDWINPNLLTLNGSPPVDMVDVFTRLHPEAPKLKALNLIARVVDGQKLISYLEKMAVSTPKMLASLTIDGCMGLSRADCELLSPMVGNLDVFRTYHDVPSSRSVVTSGANREEASSV